MVQGEGIGANKDPLIVWEDKYATGIDAIDKQHKELINLTNELFYACLTGTEVVGAAFKEVLSRMVEYVTFHFNAELEILARIKYPQYTEHKTQHDGLIKKILIAAKDYEIGKKFVPNTFVRTLRDWIFGHIAYYDKIYAAYIADQKKKGLLSDRQINGLA